MNAEDKLYHLAAPKLSYNSIKDAKSLQHNRHCSNIYHNFKFTSYSCTAKLSIGSQEFCYIYLYIYKTSKSLNTEPSRTKDIKFLHDESDKSSTSYTITRELIINYFTI